MDILKKCDYWAQFTYEDYIKNKYGENIYNIYGEFLIELPFMHEKMTGSSITKHDRSPISEKNSYGISFAEIFSRIINSGTVCDYIIKIIDEGIERNLSVEITNGLVYRGLRSFSSFLREIHFKNILREVLDKRKIEYDIETSLELDMKYHTDLLLRYNGREYAIWLYQSSLNGIKNTREKVLGNRGEIRNGYNVLCPINIKSTKGDVFVRQEWCFYSEKYIRNILGTMELDRFWRYKDVYSMLNSEKSNHTTLGKSFISEPRIIWKE